MNNPLSPHDKNLAIEQRLFGRTLKTATEAEIVAAMKVWTQYPGCDLIGNWKNREGKPYQQDLEQHVANWRKAPRSFCADLNLCVDVMQPRLRELGLQAAWITTLAGTRHQMMSEWYCLNLSAEARVDAALAALDAAEGKA